MTAVGDGHLPMPVGIDVVDFMPEMMIQMGCVGEIMGPPTVAPNAPSWSGASDDP